MLVGNSYAKENKIDLTKEEIEFIKAHPTIRVANDKGYPPYDFYENGRPTGYSIELISILLQKLGIKTEFESSDDWDSLVEKIKNGKIDILTSITQTEGDGSYVNFTNSYVQSYIVFVTRQGEPKISTLKGVDGKRFAIPDGYDHLARFKENNVTIKHIKVDNMLEALRAVSRTQAEATSEDSLVINYLLQKHGFYNLETTPQTDAKYYDFVFGVRKNLPILTNLINKALQNLSIQEKSELNQKWLINKNKQSAADATLDFLPNEIDFINANKSLRICAISNKLPFQGLDNDDKYTGMASDFLALISSKLNLKTEIVLSEDYSNAYKLFKNQKCDILPFVNLSFVGQEDMKLTTPYLKGSLVVAMKIDKPFFQDANELKSKKIAILEDCAFLQFLKNNFADITFVTVKTEMDGLKMVQDGTVDGYCDLLQRVGYLVAKNSLFDIKIGGQLIEDFSFSFATRKNEIVLNNVLQKTLDGIDDNQKQTIINKWASVKIIKGVDYSLVIKISFVVLVLILLILYWNRKLLHLNLALKAAKQKADDASNELTKLNLSLKFKVEESVKELREKDQLIIQKNKLADMGEMISNIAHQWRQPLGSANMIVSILKNNLKSGNIKRDNINSDDFKAKLDEIESLNLHMSKTIEDFLSFFSPTKTKEIFDVQIVIEKAGTILHHNLLKNNVSLKIEAKDSVKFVGFKNELLQVLISILNNSIQAFDPKNTQRNITIETKIKNNELVVSIEDNAGGIDELILDKIFDPYFTTKDQSAGTGLGLYIAQMIIQNSMNGKILAKNTQYGARFEIVLKYDLEINNAI